MAHKAIPRGKVSEAISVLSKKHRIVAAVPKGKSFVFSVVSDPSQVVLDYPTTILPLKKFFLPPHDLLMSYDRKTQSAKAPAIDAVPTVYFGVHNYELQGLFRLDYAFRTGVPDTTYLARRENAVFVGVGYQPDSEHFADSVGIPPSLREGFDAFLTRIDELWRIEPLTPKGEELIAELSGLLVPCEAKGYPVVHFKNKLKQSVAGIREIFHGAYNHPVWQKTARECYSCGTCNIVCPTCYCFDVDDQTELGGDGGMRLRRWDSCQFLSFTTVAGGESFREKRHDRVRHRMSRKFSYITDEKGRPFCVGCGRCVRQCTANISIVDVMNALL
jgi:formate hydrogenlyase subunit 6/NADH:ubiquinone oxidoreductase subunit I